MKTTKLLFVTLCGTTFHLSACDHAGREFVTEYRNGVQNGGFETNDFSGWESLGQATVVGAEYGTPPSAGQLQGLLTTRSGPGSGAVASFLGVSLADLGDGRNGAALRRTMDVQVGDVLTFDWNFLTLENNPSPFNDFLFTVDGEPIIIADTNSTMVLSNTEFQFETGYQTYTHVFAEAGEFQLGIGVLNARDNAIDSAVLLDNVMLLGETVIDFETDSDDTLMLPGEIVGQPWAGFGVTLTCTNAKKNAVDACVIFNSAAPTGGDATLGTPHKDFGGPGRGYAGGQGEPGQNDVALNNVMVIAKSVVDADGDDLVDNPADAHKGGVMHFEFEQATTVNSVQLLDVDYRQGRGIDVELLTAEGEQLEFSALPLGNNSVQTLMLETADVEQMLIHFHGHGALAQLELGRIFGVGAATDPLPE